MKLKDLLPEGFVVMYKVRKDLKNVNIGPKAWYKDKSDAEKFLKSVEKDGGKGMIVKDKTPNQKSIEEYKGENNETNPTIKRKRRKTFI